MKKLQLARYSSLVLVLMLAKSAIAAEWELTFPESSEETDPVAETDRETDSGMVIRYSGGGGWGIDLWGIFGNYDPLSSGILNYSLGPWTPDSSKKPNFPNPIAATYAGTYTGLAGPRVTHNLSVVVYPGQAVTLAGVNLTNQPLYVTSWIDVLSRNGAGLTTKNFSLTDTSVIFKIPMDANPGEAEVSVWARVYQPPYYNDYYKISAPMKLVIVPKPPATAAKWTLTIKPLAPAAKKFLRDVGRNGFVINQNRAGTPDKDRVRFSVPAEDSISDSCLRAAQTAMEPGKTLIITGWGAKKTEVGSTGTLRTFTFVRGTSVDASGQESRLISCTNGTTSP